MLMSVRREGGGALDDLAVGLDSGAITRGRAIKLAGAALLSGALGVFAAVDEAEARTRCGRNKTRCVRRTRRRKKVFCCPRHLVDVSGCRTVIANGLCVGIG